MASAREHMASNHGKEQAHWSEFGKGLRNVATHLRSMHKESGMTGECKPADAVDKLADLAVSHSNYHGEQVEACKKALDAEMNKLVPSNVSAIVPDLPADIRRVPRTGQPKVPVKPNVPLEFEKVFSIDGDDE
jgi:hypothetical protein